MKQLTDEKIKWFEENSTSKDKINDYVTQFNSSYSDFYFSIGLFVSYSAYRPDIEKCCLEELIEFNPILNDMRAKENQYLLTPISDGINGQKRSVIMKVNTALDCRYARKNQILNYCDNVKCYERFKSKKSSEEYVRDI